MFINQQLLHRSLEESWEVGAEDNDLFSVPVFFVLLRETVEVCLIVSTTFAYLADNKMSQYKRYAVMGTAIGSLVFLIVGGALVATFYTVKNNAFSSSSDSEKVFEGTLMLFSAIIISIFGIGMSKMFNNLNAKMNKKMEKISLAFHDATSGSTKAVPAAANDVVVESPERMEEAGSLQVAKGSENVSAGDNGNADSNNDGDAVLMTPEAKRKLAWSVLSVTFFAVVREGLECVVFLAGLTATYPAQSIPLAAFAGTVTGAVIGYLFYRFGSFMNMKYFAIISMSLLFMVAAGLVARSFHEWVEIGADGGPYVWDAEWCCSTATPFWGFLQTIFGYNDHPTVLEFMVYWTYWAVLLFACWRLKVFESFKTLEEAETVGEPMKFDGKQSETDEIKIQIDRAEEA